MKNELQEELFNLFIMEFFNFRCRNYSDYLYRSKYGFIKKSYSDLFPKEIVPEQHERYISKKTLSILHHGNIMNLNIWENQDSLSPIKNLITVVGE